MSDKGWASALKAVAGAHRPLIALDFDGTLAPFELDSSKARIPPAGQAALARLAAIPELCLALISGRSLADLLTVVDPPIGTRLVGDHGAQFGFVDDDGPHLAPVELTSAQRRDLAALDTAASSLAGNGAWLERKATSVVVHTRPMASREAAEQIRAQARQIGVHLNATALEGKEVVELAVVKVSKGEALARLRAEHRAGIVLYAGDDVTDETVFATLGRDDIGIKVGDGASAAKLRASDPADVARFLQMLADQLNAQ